MISFCIVPSVFGHSALARVRNQVEYCVFGPATTIDARGVVVVDNKARRSAVAQGDWQGQLDDIVGALKDIVISVNKSHFRFDISGSFIWQLIKYDPGSYHSWHTDWKFDEHQSRKLSVVVPITAGDDYMGGDLVIQGDDIEVGSRRAGDANIFGGVTRHKVTPLVRGNRIVLVGWALGRHFS